MITGVAELPLHDGKCPKWLFDRMVKLCREIVEIIVIEYGKNEFLKRIADPFWFQALSCVAGYDWNSSGCTTVTTGALKEGIGTEMGIAILGGKGKASREVTNEIEKIGGVFNFSDKKIEDLKYTSRIVAKVDNAVLQDGFQLYHHSFIVSEDGGWVVIQQGMDTETKYARRYHWISEGLKNLIEEPHAAVVCDIKKTNVLNMTAKESEECRNACVDLVNDNPLHLKKYLLGRQKLLNEFMNDVEVLRMPMRHKIIKEDLGEEIIKTLKKVYEIQPKNYEELIAIKGVGPKTIRALALISDLIYGAKASWKDCVIKYSFAHGGKDGYPYKINKKQYDKSIEVLEDAIKMANIGKREKLDAIKRLNSFLINDIN
ncbi:MAG: DUF763 domain-containing protein [Candidatus Nanoarchaeia archaeon]|nr:DUF763 domain-containing protein [Candidatus Jingweiarchaeum tengchongense]